MKLRFLLLLISFTTLWASNIKVEDAYIRATPPGLPNSAAFMRLINMNNYDVFLISASSNISKIVELHTHDIKDGIIYMYQIPNIKIKANSTTILEPSGFHIMFIGLKNPPLRQKEEISMKLNFSNAESLNIIVPIESVMKHHKMSKSKMSCGTGKCGK